MERLETFGNHKSMTNYLKNGKYVLRNSRDGSRGLASRLRTLGVSADWTSSAAPKDDKGGFLGNRSVDQH